MTLHWFVQSRGLRADEDYTWCALDEDPPASAYQILAEGYQGRPCLELLDEELPGLLLFDAPDRGIVFLVTGLSPAQCPKDFYNRPIRANLLGVASPDDETGQQALVAIGVQALRDEGTACPLISYGTGKAGIGYTVDSRAWSARVDRAVSQLDAQAGIARHGYPGANVICPDTGTERELIATELARLWRDQGAAGLLGRVTVLRTGRLNLQEIQQVMPWRVLSGVSDGPKNIPARGPLATHRLSAIQSFLTDRAEELRDRLGDIHLPPLLSVIALALAGVAATLVLAGRSPRPAQHPPVRPAQARLVSPFYAFARPSPPSLVTIPAAGSWLDTGITVRAHRLVVITATGQIQVRHPSHALFLPPGGLNTPPSIAAGRCPSPQGIHGRRRLAPELPCWSLVGRIGPAGPSFLVGSGPSVAAPGQGELYLAINGSCARCTFTGDFTAELSRSGG